MFWLQLMKLIKSHHQYYALDNSYYTHLIFEMPYTITDEELTQEKLNEYNKCCQEHDFDGDYLLSSLITAKTFEMYKGG